MGVSLNTLHLSLTNGLGYPRLDLAGVNDRIPVNHPLDGVWLTNRINGSFLDLPFLWIDCD